MSHLRVFGSVAYQHVSDEFRMPLDDKGDQMILVGYHTMGGYYSMTHLTKGSKSVGTWFLMN